MITKPEFELPNPFVSSAGLPVRSPEQWRSRRKEIYQLTIPLAYGDMPPVPETTRCVELHAAVVKRLGGAGLLSCRVETGAGVDCGRAIDVPAGYQHF